MNNWDMCYSAHRRLSKIEREENVTIVFSVILSAVIWLFLFTLFLRMNAN